MPSEHELALRFGVNRTTLRSALHELEHLGLVDRRQGSRARVLDWRMSGSVSLLRFLLAFDGVPDQRKVSDLVDVVAGFLVVLTRAICIADDRVDLGEAELCHARLAQAASDGDVAQTQRLIRDLYDSLCQASGSDVFRLVSNAFMAVLEVELDPEMNVMKALAEDAVLDDAFVCRLGNLLSALKGRREVRSRTLVVEIFDHVKYVVAAASDQNAG